MSSSTTSLATDWPTRREQILATCREHHVAVTDVHLDEGLLQLVPASLSELPAPARLQRLGAALQGGDVRWVTLLIEESA